MDRHAGKALALGMLGLLVAACSSRSALDSTPQAQANGPSQAYVEASHLLVSAERPWNTWRREALLQQTAAKYTQALADASTDSSAYVGRGMTYFYLGQ